MMIIAAKRAMNTISGKADINNEEFMTATIRVEALLNSRLLI